MEPQAQCSPRKRYAERAARMERAARGPEPRTDPFTPLERWFYRLPNLSLDTECGCGSGKPVLYWSPEDGNGCEVCRGSLMLYIPTAVMYNIAEKFGITGELREKIYAQVREGSAGHEQD